MPEENRRIFELVGSEPHNVNFLNDSLAYIRENTFANLYDIQKSLADITRFDIDMANYSDYTDKKIRYNIPIQFIYHSCRINYRRSNLYKKELTHQDIINNSDLFTNSVLVFINGELYTNYLIKPMEDITVLLFNILSDNSETNGFSRTVMNELIANNAHMSLIFVPFHFINGINLNRFTLLNYATVPEYMGIPTANFVPINSNTSHNVNQYLSFVNIDDSNLYKYNFLDYTVSNNKYYPNAAKVRTLTNTHSNIYNIHLQDLLNRIDLPSTEEYFELPIKDMPIPIENMLTFEKDGDNIKFDHTTQIQLYYPNIYHVTKTHNHDLIIFCYYSDDTVSIGNKYNNELAVYYRFTNNVLERYKNNTIPELIKNYQPYTISYDINDYKTQEYDHLIYKSNKLNDAIFENGNHYSVYLNKLIKYTPRFTVDVSGIDLTSRLRTDNSHEVSSVDNIITFDEPCYLFIFRHDGNNDKIIMYVDNYYFKSEYEYVDNNYRYVYIPTRLVNQNSILDVEKFVDVTRYITINSINTTINHLIPFSQNTNTRPDDIFVTYTENNEDYYVPKTSYSILWNNNGVYTAITDTNFYNYYDALYIKITDETYLNKDLIVHGDLETFSLENIGSNDFYISNRLFNNDRRKFLLFKNGQLVPLSAMSFEFSNKVNGPHHVRVIFTNSTSDVFTLIYNNNRYTRIYYASRIDPKGVCDLTGLIDKPIDLKYYDIYLNGLKLTENNIDIIGPYIMIISGVNTIRNLEIYQKNLDNVEFSDISTNDIHSRVYDLISDQIKDGISTIDDSMPDIMDSIVIDFIGFLDNYLYDLTIINPDLQQITDEMIENHSFVFIEHNILYMNPNSPYAMEKTLLMNPDDNTNGYQKI